MAEPLVLLPDLMCDARLYGPQIADLSREMAVMVAPVTGGERVEEVASGLLDLMPRYDVQWESCRRVSMQNVAGYSHVPVRILA